MLSTVSLASQAGMKMTLEEIARFAGVSRSTVSRVINDDPNVRAATRAWVWQGIKAAERLNPQLKAWVELHARQVQTLQQLDDVAVLPTPPGGKEQQLSLIHI